MTLLRRTYDQAGLKAKLAQTEHKLQVSERERGRLQRELAEHIEADEIAGATAEEAREQAERDHATREMTLTFLDAREADTRAALALMRRGERVEGKFYPLETLQAMRRMAEAL